jgi:hypothetical protein
VPCKCCVCELNEVQVLTYSRTSTDVPWSFAADRLAVNGPKCLFFPVRSKIACNYQALCSFPITSLETTLRLSDV